MATLSGSTSQTATPPVAAQRSHPRHSFDTCLFCGTMFAMPEKADVHASWLWIRLSPACHANAGFFIFLANGFDSGLVQVAVHVIAVGQIRGREPEAAIAMRLQPDNVVVAPEVEMADGV